MGTGCGQIGSIQEIRGRGLGVERKKRRMRPFSLVTSAPEYGDNMFLRNVGIYLQIHTAPKANTSTT
jgi:hypothetical protein